MKPIHKIPFYCFLFLFFSVVWVKASPLISFQMLRGKAGNQTIVLYLYQNDRNYSGYYYYENHQRPFALQGFDSTLSGNILLRRTTGRYQEIIKLTQKDPFFYGTLIRENEEGRAITLELRRVTPALRMQYLYRQDTVKLLKDESAYPSCNVSLGLVWPLDEFPGFDLLKQKLAASIDGLAYGSGDIQFEMGKLIRKELDKYKNDYFFISEQELKRAPRSYSVDILRRVQVVHQTHRFISFVSTDHEFSGGAHGNTKLHYFTWDRRTEKHFSLSELFDPKAMDDLKPILAKRYLLENGFDPDTPLNEAGLFENKLVVPPSSAYLTEKGIIFHYNPYTIAAYSKGMIDIFVPFKELRLLLEVPLLKYLGWEEMQP